MRFIHLLAVLLTGAMLAGCMLQSTEPRFADTDASLLPFAQDQRWQMESKTQAGWEAEEGWMRFTADGGHQQAVNEKGEVLSLWPVSLGQGWWVLQMQDKPGSYYYALLEQAGSQLVLHNLPCEELKKNGAVSKLMEVRGDDCFAGKNFDKQAFAAVAKAPPPGLMRLTPLAP